VTEIRDAFGAVTRVRYDGAGHPIATIRPDYTPPGASAPLRGEVDDTYSAAGDLVASVDERGTATRYSYDVAGNRIRDDLDLGGGKQRSVVTAYDQENKVRAVTSAGGAVTYFAHDELGRLVGQFRMQVEDSCCVEGAATDPTIIEYDDAGDVTDVWAHGINGDGPRSLYSPPGAHTQYSYNAAGEMTERIDPNALNPARFQHDLKGRVTRETTTDGVAVEHSFDLAGREISTTRIGTDGARQSISSSFDADGRVTAETRANGQHRTADYDLAGRRVRLTEQLTADTTRSVAQSFDVVGRLVRTEDANGHLTWRTYNSWGLLEKTVAPLAPNSVSLSDRTWQYSYEPGGRLSVQTSPGGAVRQNSYDPVGQLTQITATDPHDASATVDRHVTRTTTGEVASIDTPGGTQAFTWGSWGQLLTARGPLMNANYSYDDFHRLRTETRWNATAEATRSDISHDYDSAGRASAVSTNTNGQVLRQASTFDAKTGRLASESYAPSASPTDTPVGRTDFGYDAFGRRNSEAVSSSGTTQTIKTVYAFDAADDVVSKTVTGQPVPDGGTYEYDLASRLISWQPNAPPDGGSQPAKTTYTWDAANNRLAINDGTTRQGWTYDQRDRIRGAVVETAGRGTVSTSFDSNPRGDITAIGARTLQYNALDELVSDNGTTFGYDSLGRLTSRGDQTLQYDGLATEPSGTIGGAGTNETTVSGSPGAATLSWNLTNKTAGALIANGHSDAVGRLDAAGAIAAPTTYDPFGTRTAGSSTAGATTYLGYQGGWTDPATGSVRMGARWYEPTLGRFLTQDTADVPVTNGGSTNLFAYADANPLSNVDPSGHDAIGITSIPGLIGDLLSGGEGLVDAAFGAAAKGVAFDQAAARGLSGATAWVGRAGAAAVGAIEAAAAGAGELAAADLLVDVGVIAAPEVAIGVGFVVGAAWAVDALTAPRVHSEPVAAPVAVATAPTPTHSLINRTVNVSVQPGAYANTRTVSVTNGIRTTTETFWGQETVDLFETFADNTWHRHISSSRVITGQEWFSEPLVNPARPGMTLTESSIAVARTPAVTTPNRALSTAAESCGIGGTIASCQTPSLGAGLCGSLAATSSLCMPAEPLPGRAGGVQSNTPHQKGGAARSEPGGSSGADASSGGCPPGLEALGLCGNEEADPVATRGGREPVLKGQEGENAVREQYDIGERGQTARINGKDRVFDGLNDEAVSEVKNVGRLWFSRQLRDYADFAESTGRRLDIYVRQGTRLSKQLQRASLDPNSPVNVIRFLP
jgi:RHS repeat-associated protein